MNLWQALVLPWQLNQRGMRWMVLVLLGVAVTGATAFAVFSDKPDMWVRLADMAGLVEGLIWSACLTHTVLLTVDAHQLRVPGITGRAVVGLVLNGALGSLLPALVIGAFNGHFVTVTVLIALSCVCGFLYSLLPRVAGFALFVILFNTIIDHSWRQWPARADFLVWAVPVLVSGLILIAVCWRRLIFAPNPYRASRNAPPVLRIGRMASTAHAGRSGIAAIRSRPDWLQARPDLHGCGPGHPVQSLRMALGGAGTPQTFAGWLRQSSGTVFSLSILVTFLVVWMLVLSLRGQSAQILAGMESGGAMALLGVAAGICVMQAITSSTYLTARWRLVNAELPLLALLPRLGTHVKRDVLRAALWPTARTLFVAALLVLVVLARVHQQEVDIFAVLVIVTAAAHVLAVSLYVLGNGRRGAWDSRVAGILGLVLFFLGVMAVVLASHPGHAPPLLGVLWQALLAGWLIEIAMVFRVGRRGWRGLQQRPHPFLVN
jgi:hypothetical protein